MDRRAALARKAALAAVMAGGMALAWWQRFVLDDAFIAFRYARHAARGMGFVWNAGEPPLEGFTSFTWTLLLTLAARCGLDLERASLALGVLCFGGTLLATYALAFATTWSWRAALVATALVAASPTASAFATSGLETSAQTLLATATLAVLASVARSKKRRAKIAVLAGVLAGLAVTVRMDAVVLLLLVLATLFFVAGRRAALVGAASASVLVVPWLVYRVVTFGRLLPNTYAAKVAFGASTLVRGVEYLAGFAVTSGLLVAFALAVGSFARRRQRVAAPSFAFVIAWCAYVALVGGDFMEFRFMTCAIPAMCVLFQWMLRRELRSAPPRIALNAALVIAFLFAWRTTRGESYFHRDLSVETVRALANHVDGPEQDWRAIGRTLERTFREDRDVVLALRAAGVIADESDLPVVDVFGLNDRWVAEHGTAVRSGASGHQRIAPISYLQERGVNLVFGSWSLRHRGDPANVYAAKEVRRQFLQSGDVVPANAVVLEIPIDEERALRCVYLTRHPAVEAKLTAPGWRVFPIVR